MDGRACFKIVKTSISKGFPKGDAKLAWSNLHLKYRPSNKTPYIRLKNEFNNRSLRKGEGPDDWFTDLESINLRLEEDFNKQITEDNVILHILNHIPSDYNMTKQILFKEMRKRDVKLEEVQEDIREAHAEQNKTEAAGNDELGLFSGVFKGNCRICEKKVHKAKD